MTTGYLILENGQCFKGTLFGYTKQNTNICGEIVFQTGMVGYTESLTDPSYKEQILVYTYPIIGNYGISKNSFDEYGLSKVFESDRIHVNALVVQEIVEKHSHWESEMSLSEWLEKEHVVGISGIDTRELTKIIREHGTMKARIINASEIKLSDTIITVSDSPIEYEAVNLVKKVSRQGEVRYFSGPNNIHIVDCGIKNNQIRMLLDRVKEYNTCNPRDSFKVHIVPYDSYFPEITQCRPGQKNSIFISNGPGDPRDECLTPLVDRLKGYINNKNYNVSIFGICLGHQIISLATGHEIKKMKYGNRGHNIPVCLWTPETRNCGFITSQNHGYMTIEEEIDLNIPGNNYHYFKNVNDNSNEGLVGDNVFSVQFHPEARAGPDDTTFLFDVFLTRCIQSNPKTPYKDLIKSTLKSRTESIRKTPYTITNKTCKKILLLGSGGLSIGQAGEFDYSGTQAIKSFKEEGLEVILVNPNIATIQTSKGFADKVYYDPVTPHYIKQIIEKEHPDGIALSFGGQTALNCGVKLYEEGIIGKNSGIHILGTPVDAIQITEDRDMFRKMLAEIGESCAPSDIAYNREAAQKIANEIGYPVLVRAAFALGGLGSGFAHNDNELNNLVDRAFCHSPQVIIDKSLKGWKEVEYEIVRDSKDNCIAVCNMENLDPLGVHTGESIVVAPSQTLTDHEYFKLRNTAFKVIRKLGVIGECNIQYTLDPYSSKYYIIEVNARLSRSSALASKATGYPLAYIAGKLALGETLIELENKVTCTSSFFEPSLDYCVVKVPRWDLNKFPLVNRKIGSAMKSVGEVMAISRSFEEAFQKGLRMANEQLCGFDWLSCSETYASITREEVIEELQNPTPDRIQMIAHVLHNPNQEISMNVEEIHKYSRIDRWFLYKMERIKLFGMNKLIWDKMQKEDLRQAKLFGFSDKFIAKLLNKTEAKIYEMRKDWNMFPIVKQIDTVAAEFPCYTNYLYLTYSGRVSDVTFDQNGVIVLGSGVYRIGSSVEFDWCAVNCIRQLRESGRKTVMINYNPETVSTDYDEADRLYFDELTFESVLDIYNIEQSSGIVISMGGQVANNIALRLAKAGVNIYGTAAEKIDEAENRFKFSRMLDSLGINQPQWKELREREDVYDFCDTVGFPCLIRPSYVLSGAAMNVAYSKQDLDQYLNEAVAIKNDSPIVVSKFIMGAKEIEVDAVAYNGGVKLMAISEHVENAGIHSGDATLVLPAQDLTKDTVNKIKNTVARVGKELAITGPFNMQFMAKYDNIYVIECNLRASRSMPFASKVFDVNFIRVATNYIMMKDTYNSVEEDIYENGEGLQITKCFGRYWEPKWVGVKVPQFSFNRLDNADTKLGVEMRSTGEVACFGENKYDAYLKALMASNFDVNKDGIVIVSIGSDEYRDEFSKSLRYLESFCVTDEDKMSKVFFTPGTGKYYGKGDERILSYKEVADLMKDKHIQVGLLINISNKNSFGYKKTQGWEMRRNAINTNTPIITNIKCAKMYVYALVNHLKDSLTVKDVDYVASLDRFKGVDAQYQYNRLLGIDENNREIGSGSGSDNVKHNLDNNLNVLNTKLTLPTKLLDVSCFTRDNIRTLFSIALKLKHIHSEGLNANRFGQNSVNVLKGKCIGLLFEEPSSRTYLSFSSAIARLGGTTVNLQLSKSSIMKGESMEDTFMTFQTYVDAIIVRMSDSSLFDLIERKNICKIPIINAGCGCISHPTQALLDVLTIREERGTVNGLEISIVGDLKNGRTVKSLLRLLRQYRVKVNLVPYNDYLYPDDGFLNDIQRSGVVIERFNSLNEVMKNSDVIYMTRMQQERGSIGDVFVLNTELLSQAKEDLVIMHPLPRNQEISREVDSDPRAAYFRQMDYGLWLRMAILYNLFA
jgi:carbamoyl-phosphate synthase / aspartate carbamoyltransferase